MSNQQQGDCLDAYPVFVLSQLRPRYRDRVERRLAGTPKTLTVLSISSLLLSISIMASQSSSHCGNPLAWASLGTAV